MTIEPIFENEFREGSHGFRPGPGAKDALREVDRLAKEGYRHAEQGLFTVTAALGRARNPQ